MSTLTYNQAIKVNARNHAREVVDESEWDAETLARARAIQADKERLANAQQAAAVLATRKAEQIEQQQRQMQEMANLAAIADKSKGRPINVQKVRGGDDFPNEVITPQGFRRNQQRAIQRLASGSRYDW